MLSDVAVRLIRTYVPLAVGLIVSNLPFLSEALDADVWVAGVVAGYYAFAAWLETKYDWAGWLLGMPKSKTA